MGVKVGLLHYGKNIDWGCLRTECWKYLDLSGMKWQEAEESNTMESS
jgi:hypothetical protein